MGLEIKSSAFRHQEYIPRQYTCEGKDISVDLSWKGAPAGTKSFALICDDPDAPMGTWVHWVIYNIPASVTQLPEAIPARQRLEDDTGQGINGFRKIGYGGPCPPPGKPHRYFFKLYALDSILDIKGTPTKEALLKAMEGHILDEAVIMGLYKR